MPAARSNDKPKINFNLDTIERDNQVEPFKFNLGGKVWTAVDPLEVDWQDLADVNVNDLRQVISVLMGDKYDEFVKIKVPAWKVNRLAQAMIDHYGLMNLGEDNAS